jgi:hypothetical protein
MRQCWPQVFVLPDILVRTLTPVLQRHPQLVNVRDTPDKIRQLDYGRIWQRVEVYHITILVEQAS